MVDIIWATDLIWAGIYYISNLGLWDSKQGGIEREGAVQTQDPTHVFLTSRSLNSQLPEHTQHHRSWNTDHTLATYCKTAKNCASLPTSCRRPSHLGGHFECRILPASPVRDFACPHLGKLLSTKLKIERWSSPWQTLGIVQLVHNKTIPHVCQGTVQYSRIYWFRKICRQIVPNFLCIAVTNSTGQRIETWRQEDNIKRYSSEPLHNCRCYVFRSSFGDKTGETNSSVIS